MKIHKIKRIVLAILIVISAKVYSAPKETITATYVYSNIAIQSVEVAQSDKIHVKKLIIAKSRLKSCSINNQIFQAPEIEDPIWSITARDLHVSEEACLEIDALLCRDYHGVYKPNEANCYDTCIATGPDFLTYDENADILYITAGTNVVGTGATPVFLFAANIHEQKIKYLNTIADPNSANLSPNGKYLALNGWNEIDVCNTESGEYFQIRDENTFSANHELFHNMENIKWLSNAEFKYVVAVYRDKFQNKLYGKTEKIYNMNIKKIISSYDIRLSAK